MCNPAFADMLIVQRLGGRRVGSAWIWPATHANAVLLQKHFRVARITPEFAALLAPRQRRPEIENPQKPAEPMQDTAAPTKPELAVKIPEGLRTPPWRHQGAGFNFCLERFAAGFRGVLLAMSMGVGKTMVALMVLLWLKAARVMIACRCESDPSGSGRSSGTWQSRS